MHIDFHHTTEDTGYVVGEAVSKALGDRAGIARYGHAVIPMDETLTQVSLDASNRPYLVWKVAFTRPKLGEMDTELFKEWFQAFAQSAGVTLHVENLYGENNHHIVEILLQGLGTRIAPGGRDRPAARRRGAVDQGRSRRQPLMIVAIVDYGSGNLRSAAKAFERAAMENRIAAEIEVTSAPDQVAGADRVVLPGVGAFADCRRGLAAVPGLEDALREAVHARARPFLGICVGMQLMAERGREFETTEGLGWIEGEVVAIDPADRALKVPHMGWNELTERRAHPLLAGIEAGAHAYFVHSYHLRPGNDADLVAVTEYGGPLAAIVGHDNLAGTQFHPEKSQEAGLRLIGNFLRWRP